MTSEPLSSRSRKGRMGERLVLVLVLLGIALILGLVVTMVDQTIRAWTARDLARRAVLVARALDPVVVSLPESEIRERFESVSRDDRLVGVLLCGPANQSVSNSALGAVLTCSSPLARAAMAAEGNSISGDLGRQEVMVTSHSMAEGRRLIVVQDRAFIWARRRGVIQIGLLGGIGALLVAMLLARFGARASRRRMTERVRDLFRLAEEGKQHEKPLPADLSSILHDLDRTVSRIRSQRKTEGESSGKDRLRQMISDRLPETPLVLVANREPYSHVRDHDRVRVERPASGLVSGVEPLLRAVGGVWIGHGSGNADRETADAKGRLGVPPESPEYVLRRIWLSKHEEEGYYYGFSNEGLWPLCHIAHARPTFRQADWDHYRSVNKRFAEAAAEEAGPRGMILVQDYHFALLPLELRRLQPDAVVSLFWHIPWPNHEVVGICPWRKEILEGMLGADVIGFHTRYHCLNFLETAQRYLECRVDLESMSVELNQHKTLVRPYPISVEWPYESASREEGRHLRQELGIPDEAHVALGVDRTDYTKGLLERVAAVETLLTQHPELIGRFVMVQLAAPSRTHIKRYRDLISELEEAVAGVNRRFSREGGTIILKIAQHQPDEVKKYYAMADSALVTPLHDGMNLVAKEYVAACADGDGVLVLSAFAGASKELEGALVVNPYDTGDVAAAIYRALTMPEEERRARMSSMRAAIEKNTIYDWSAKLMSDMAEVWEHRHASWRQKVATVRGS